MCNFSFNFRPSTKEKEGHIFIRLIYKRRATTISTSYRIYPSEWDERRKRIVHPLNNKLRINYLTEIEEAILKDSLSLKNIIAELEIKKDYSLIDVVEKFKRRKDNHSLRGFTESLIEELIQSGQDRTARAYKTCVTNLIEFNGGKDLSLEDIKTSLVKQYEESMKSRGKTLNTISFYMRNLRAIYNRAIKNNYILSRTDNPFTDVFTGVHVTKKRALSKQEVKVLSSFEPLAKNLKTEELVLPKGLEQALLFFLFSFHTRGMSFVDMSFLKKENIKNDVIRYFRKKTGQLLEVKVNSIVKNIIKKYEPLTLNSPYVLPIITSSNIPERLQYESALRLQNKRLKRLASLIGIENDISTHVARHSWATLAKQENLPLWIISEALGHTNEKTTYIYLASFDHEVLDSVTDKIWKAVKKAM